MDRCEEVEHLYRTHYQGFTARHFHEHLVRDHRFAWSYSWTKAFRTVFVEALFAHADEGTFVSLRSFPQSDRGVPPPYIRGVKLNGAGYDALINEAVEGARFSANAEDALVFAPPIATFHSSRRASEEHLANGLVLSVELDAGNTTKARGRLEDLLGPATVVVASGGQLADPETGEVYRKLHLHWRLSEPTREAADHARLKLIRRCACDLVGADPSATTPVHPLRWPGSWHLKGTPRLARVISLNPDAEVSLGAAEDALGGAVEAAGLRKNGDGTPEADPVLVASALRAIPNPDLPWDEWVRIGMATWRTTAGATAGTRRVAHLVGEVREIRDGGLRGAVDAFRHVAADEDRLRHARIPGEKAGWEWPEAEAAKDAWPEPIDFLADAFATPPELHRGAPPGGAVAVRHRHGHTDGRRSDQRRDGVFGFLCGSDE